MLEAPEVAVDGQNMVTIVRGRSPVDTYTILFYSWISEGWIIKRFFDLDLVLEGGNFSDARVALSDKTAFIGFPNILNGAGAVYVYKQNRGGYWEKVEDHFAHHDDGSNYAFGNSVGIDGDLACVAGLFGVHLFRQAKSKWVHVDMINATSAQCSIAGDTFAIVDQNSDSFLRLYKYDAGLGGVQPLQDPISAGVSLMDLSNDQIVFSSWDYDGGDIFIYRREGSNGTFALHQQIGNSYSGRYTPLAFHEDLLVIGEDDRTRIFSEQDGRWEETFMLGRSYDKYQFSGRTLLSTNETGVYSFNVEDCVQPEPTSTPSAAPSPSPSASPTSSGSPSFTSSPNSSPSKTCFFSGEVNILTDGWPQETSWTISRIDDVGGVVNSKVVIEGSPEKDNSYHTSGELCLERGDYEFAIFDSCGDGIFSPGHYNVTFEGVVIAQGAQFHSEERVSFSLPLPSPQPSESSFPSKFPSASFQPSESIIPSQSLSPSLQPSNSFSPSTYWSSLKWNRQGLGFSGDTSDDFFGAAVAISADASTMAVGAPGELNNDSRPGYVKVYHREGEGSSWEQQGDTIQGEANGDCFGYSLALSDDGTTLSIGAPFHKSDSSESGQVKVYKWNKAALNYMQIGNTLYGVAFGDDYCGDQFGWSLGISNGEILAVGARYSNANGNDSGQVTVYAWDDASADFKQRGQAINGDAASDLFGYSISFTENGQKLAVGAHKNDSKGSESGQVRVFGWDEATLNYVQLGDPLLGDAAGDWFGWSVSFSRDGTALAIGAPNDGENGQYSGQAKVFAWDEATSNFKQIGRSLFGKTPGDKFGVSVALADGRTLAVGATQPSSDKPSYVEVYGWDEASSDFKQFGQSLGSEASYDWFGKALTLSGNGRVLAIGAPESDANGTDSGRVEVFDIMY